MKKPADIELSLKVHPGMRWHCISCGTCCSNIGIKEWFDESLKVDLDIHGENGCRFLDFNNGNSFCKEYGKRPGACRRYPFHISRDGDEYHLSIHTRCEGRGKGPPVYVDLEFKRILELVELELGIQYIIESSSDENSYKLHRII